MIGWCEQLALHLSTSSCMARLWVFPTTNALDSLQPEVFIALPLFLACLCHDMAQGCIRGHHAVLRLECPGCGHQLHARHINSDVAAKGWLGCGAMREALAPSLSSSAITALAQSCVSIPDSSQGAGYGGVSYYDLLDQGAVWDSL
jgi:hypothetical protein